MLLTVTPRSRLRRAAEALLTPHPVDRYLELVDPLWSVGDIRAEVVSAERRTADTVTLTLRPNRHWPGFVAGQHVQLTVEIDGVRRTRSYSMASSQHRADGRIELTVKAMPDGTVSPFLREHARPGMVVHLSAPAGDFTLPAERPARTLLVSGGSGVTPVMAMLRTLCDEGHDGEVVFLHYAFTEADVAYRAELAELSAAHPNVKVVLAYTEQTEGGDHRGLYPPEHLATAMPAYADAAIFLCGPGPLMDAVTAHCDETGILEQLHTERFTPPAFVPLDDAPQGTIRFTSSGIAVANDGRTLLEQAEAAGLTPASGCRMGICRTCTRRKDSGCVVDATSGVRSGAGEEPVQICVSVAAGDVAIDL
jgi:ferredoxin-NADP reductase